MDCSFVLNPATQPPESYPRLSHVSPLGSFLTASQTASSVTVGSAVHHHERRAMRALGSSVFWVDHLGYVPALPHAQPVYEEMVRSI